MLVLITLSLGYVQLFAGSVTHSFADAYRLLKIFLNNDFIIQSCTFSGYLHWDIVIDLGNGLVQQVIIWAIRDQYLCRHIELVDGIEIIKSRTL